MGYYGYVVGYVVRLPTTLVTLFRRPLQPTPLHVDLVTRVYHVYVIVYYTPRFWFTFYVYVTLVVVAFTLRLPIVTLLLIDVVVTALPGDSR